MRVDYGRDLLSPKQEVTYHQITRDPTLSSANLRSEAIGSEPGERTNISGVIAVESKKEGSMAKGMGSTKRFPMDSATKLVIAGTNCIAHRTVKSRPCSPADGGGATGTLVV